MQDPDHDTTPPHLNRRETFDEGTTPNAEPAAAAAKAKGRLKGIIRNRVILPKGSYKYQRLASDDDIRVLRILKGKQDATLECTLMPSGLPPPDNAPPSPPRTATQIYSYEALSYWWGNDEPRNEIIIYSYIDGSDSSNFSLMNLERANFYIRSNLEGALRQLRSEDHDVDVWVDAICINQENKKEKTEQVKRMHEIYMRARNVCIWLGAGRPETKETFDFLWEILNLKRLDELIVRRESPERWKLVVQLIKNKWFSRRWVIQELALAKNATVRWGAESMPWSSFADAIALFMTKHDDIKQILSRDEYPRTRDPFTDARVLGANTLVNATNNLFRKSEDGEIQQRLLTLEVLVSCLLLAFEASDPRDTIYAVLSIAKDTSFANSDLTARTSWMIQKHQKSNGLFGIFGTAIRDYCSQALLRLFLPPPATGGAAPPPDPRIAPDYDKSLMDVCADFMDYCTEESHSLDILCRHWAPLPRQKNTQEVLKEGGGSKEEGILPSWIPSIKGYAFGAPEDALNGRMNGDSFVGSLERQNQQHYNASAGLWPYVKFGKLKGPEAMLEPPELGLQRPTQPPRLISSKYDGTLYIRGFPLGEIEGLSGRVADGMINQEALEMGGWPLKNTSDKVPEQLWRTLVADRGDNCINAPSWYHRACLECLSHTNENGDCWK